jgi:hypothetical protein
MILPQVLKLGDLGLGREFSELVQCQWQGLLKVKHRALLYPPADCVADSPLAAAS